MLTRKLFICILLAQLVGCFEPFDTRAYLATKTPYPVPEKNLEKPEDLKECRVIHINHLARHGSRHLNKAHNIDKLYSLIFEAKKQNQLQKPYGMQALEYVQKLKNLENPENLKQLTEQGKQEHRGIAERMYKEFPDLFIESSANKALILQSSHVKRTKDSLNAFLGRLTELNPKLADFAHISSGEKNKCDPQLRFFEHCNAYKSYKKEHIWKPIVHDSIWNNNAQKDIKNILNRIFSPNFVENLDYKKQIDITRIIYNLCQLDANINKKNNHNFCTFFTKESEIENFNWEEDALSYFSKGLAGQRGHVAHRSACQLVADFVDTSQKAIADPKNAAVANFRFGHAETIMPFLVLLGLYDEDTITTMLESPKMRKFRTIKASPMGANLQWILYACPDNQYRVRMLQNEENISFPIAGCEKNTWCNFQKVKDFLNQEGRSCDKESFEKDVCKGLSCKI